ncbi:MAG: TetR/AcrR family transcriptional regulator [Desulfotignum sp.]
MGIHERKQREKQRRRRDIINAARKIFSVKGFNSATMEEIANEAELSPGTLYLYFKNKEELHTSLSIDILKYLSTQIHKVVNQDICVEEKIDRFRDVFIDVYDYDPNILINLFHLQSGETLHNLSDEMMQQLKENSSRAHGAIIQVVREGIEKKIFIDEHPVALADLLWGAYAGVVLWVDSKKRLDGQKDFVRSTLTTAFKVINQGLKRKISD